MTDQEYMQLAIELAEKGYVNPNPMVGAVIVKDGKVIGTGYHERYGGPHAERNALGACATSPEGATMYVTLEPCRHYGKTPPCTDAILESGISKVVVGCEDPDPRMAGKSIELLRLQGVEVLTGILEKECQTLNEVFFHYIKTGVPYVVMKYAMTMDGKIATRSGKSKWITGEAARNRVHQDRHRYTAIMVGVGTVLEDDPLLTSRMANSKNPIRIVCDTELRTPLDSQIVTTAKDIPTIIATACTEEGKQKPYLDQHCRIIEVSRGNQGIDLRELMRKLGEDDIDSILLEGGGSLNWSMLEGNCVNKVQAYVAPKIFGGQDAKSPVAGIGIDHPDQAFFLADCDLSILGEDILIESEVMRPPCSQES